MFKSKVPQLVGKMIVETGKVLSTSDIVEGTGLNRQTVLNWINPEKRFKSIDADVLQAWLTFFQLKDEQAGEIFVIVRNEEKSDS